MKDNILKFIFLVCSFLVSCDNSTTTTGKEELEVYILKVHTNYGTGTSSNQEQPPELYYTIVAKNNKPSPLYLSNESSPHGEEEPISNFQASLTCKGSTVYLNLYNVTSSTTYLDPYSTDTINIRAYFKEIRDRAKECGFEKVASFIEEVVREGKITYIAHPSHGKMEKGGKSYLPVDSLLIEFDERSTLEVVQ